ncbi:MAG TPA: phosphate/phosphite/phosphonate ABC transporter substrate-binding protein [Tepidisphaeraceae bacterium]
MTETSSPSNEASPVPPQRRKRTNPFILIVLAVIAAAAFAAGYYLTQVRQPLAENEKLNYELVTKAVGLADAQPLKLDPRFTDANSDAVADPINDAKSALNPEKLVFSYVAEESEQYREAFADLVKHISQVTGKPAEYAVYNSPEEELLALRDGKLHVAGLNTGVVPIAVNLCGFVPVWSLATQEGVNTYHMEIIVPADSDMQNLKDIKGHDLVLTEPGSNSGFKAPLVILSKDNGLKPVVDFRIRYSGGHEQSIEGIARKEYQVAAVASDRLARAIANGAIKKEQYRTIFTSGEFPTAAFGYLHSLAPELAGNIRKAMNTFEWKGTSLGKEFEASNQSKFSAIDYQRDWAIVRHIDDEIRGTQNLQQLVVGALQGRTENATTQPSTVPATQAAAQ